MSGWVARGVFYVLMLIVLIGVRQVLDLQLATAPFSSLVSDVLEFLPRVIGAAILVGVAWIVATLLRRIVGASLRSARLDERVAGSDDAASRAPLAASVSEAVYWFIFLLFLPAILDALRLEGLLVPVRNVFDDVLGYLPNMLGAALIGFLGWFVAGILRRIVTNLLAAAGADRLGASMGLASATERRVSSLPGLAVYVLILIPVLISALNTLELDVITGPATQMLYVAFDAIPLILGAGLVLLLAYVVGRFVAGIVTNVLQVVGFDRLLVRWKWRAEGEDQAGSEGARLPSVVAGKIALAAIVLFAAAIGFALANWIASALRASGAAQAATFARVAQIAIVVFAAAIGLRRTGLANEIVDLAFGLFCWARWRWPRRSPSASEGGTWRPGS